MLGVSKGIPGRTAEDCFPSTARDRRRKLRGSQ
jgi:hypothetical protein